MKSMKRAPSRATSELEPPSEAYGRELSESLAILLASADDAEAFAEAILRGLAALHPSRHVYVLIYGTRHRPVKHWYSPMETNITAYLSVLDLDPFAIAIRAGQTGLLTLRGVAPPGFIESEYYDRLYAGLGAYDELIHAIGPTQGLWLTAGATSGAPFPTEAISRHETAHSAIRACLLRLAELLDREGFGSDHELAGVVDGAVDRFGADVLSAREQQVVHLILRGHNSESVSQQLGISWNTVRAHRTRAYRKLGVSSQGELFYAFLRTLGLELDES